MYVYIYIYIYIYMYVYIYIYYLTIVEGNPEAALSIATTRRCREGHYSLP